MSNQQDADRSNTLTPYIAVAAHYYGTGKSLQESRKNLVKAGGSQTEEQVVYRLPEGATDAYVADNGCVYWFGVEGEMKPVYKYMNGKPVPWEMGADKAIPYTKPPMGKKGQPRHSPDAQTQGAVHPEPELTDDKESTIQTSNQPAAESDGEVDQQPTTGHAAGAKGKKVPKGKKPAKVMAKAGKSQQQFDAEGEGIDAHPATTEETTTPTAQPEEHADFLMFVGGNFYTKETFIDECKRLGISRRMPSPRLPKGLVCGKSRVFVAADGQRKTDGTVSEVFGYFTPEAVEFIALGNKMFADVVSTLKTRPDARIIDTIEGEPERGCGFRKEGGTYIVVDNAETPLVLLSKPAQFEGNHFRGLMRLSSDQTEAFTDGGTVSVLVDEKCMKCGGAMKCSPDGHSRAERERRRIEKGHEPKWLLLDAKCQKELRAARAADDGVQAAAESSGEEDGGDTAEEGTANSN